MIIKSIIFITYTFFVCFATLMGGILILKRTHWPSKLMGIIIVIAALITEYVVVIDLLHGA